MKNTLLCLKAIISGISPPAPRPHFLGMFLLHYTDNSTIVYTHMLLLFLFFLGGGGGIEYYRKSLICTTRFSLSLFSVIFFFYN